MLCRLSGESPFLGDSEADTFNRITEGRWEFSDVFDYVSREAKDFIARLLLKDPKYLLSSPIHYILMSKFCRSNIFLSFISIPGNIFSLNLSI